MFRFLIFYIYVYNIYVVQTIGSEMTVFFKDIFISLSLSLYIYIYIKSLSCRLGEVIFRQLLRYMLGFNNLHICNMD